MLSHLATSSQTSTATRALLRRGGCLLMLAVAVAAPFAGVNAGALDPCDESYQTLCAATYRKQPAAPALFATGRLWQVLMGQEALMLRYLGVLCVVAAIAIGGLWYYRRRGNAAEACLLMMTASLAASPAIFKIYNWDTGAYPAQALTLIAALGLWQRPRLWKAVVLGALCAWAALCRIQLVIYLPAALWLVARAMKGDRRRATGGLAVAFAAVWLAGVTVVCGGPAEYFGAIADGNLISGHTPANWHHILIRAWTDMLDLPLAWLPMGAALAAGVVFARFGLPGGWRRYALGALLCGWIALSADVTATFYDGIIFAADLPLFAALALLPAAFHTAGRPRTAIWICVVSVALTAFGSDAIAERYFSAYAIAPLAAVVIPRLELQARRTLWCIVIFAAFAGGCTTMMRLQQLRETCIHPMDSFRLQKGLMGSDRDVAYWRGIASEMDRRRDRRVKFVCRPYGLLLTYGMDDREAADFQNFHFRDGDAVPATDSLGSPLYDTYIFSLAIPEHLPETLKRFGDAGYRLAPGAPRGEYFILDLQR